jgi:putative transposase
MTNNIAKQFFKLEVGSEVSDGQKVYRVSHLISIDSVLAVDLATNESCKLALETLRLIDSSDAGGALQGKVAADRDLLDYSDDEWKEGQRRFQAIKPLLDDPTRTRHEAQIVAKANGVHVGTLYRWLAAYTDAGHVSALVPSKRGRKVGTMMLDPALEAILQAVIEDVYLHKQRRSPQEAIEEVERRCRLAKVVPPHPNTVRNRISRIPDRERLRRRGRKEEAVSRYTALRGSFPDAGHPFSVVQIDHTPADVIVVDEIHRKPIGRPYITLAIDVHSRMVAGFYLSLDPPSAASVGLCLAQAMCPKREYLAALGVAGSWPVWGRIATVHCDNAKEFRGAVLERACQEHGINLAWRPVKIPRYGGHIERMMGTLAGELHKLPGTTFSNIKDRKGYDSMAEASLTLKELERHLVDFFVNVYHQRVHGELGMSPLRRWEMGLVGDANTPGLGLMPLPEDPERILLDFMPFVERTVQPYGIQIDNIAYYDPVLDPYINALAPGNSASKRAFVIRRDPRDISRVYFFDPSDKRYCVIPYRNIGHPAMSLYELKEVNRRLRDDGRRDVDEHLIFEALDRMRARVAEATHKSKAARRQAHRSPGLPGGAKVAPLMSKKATSSTGPTRPTTAATATIPVDDDPFSQPVRPFEELGLRR